MLFRLLKQDIPAYMLQKNPFALEVEPRIQARLLHYEERERWDPLSIQFRYSFLL